MPYIGFRAPQSVKDAIDKVVMETDRSKSEIIRNALETYLVDHITMEATDWKIVIWTFLGIDSHKSSHAMSRSDNAEEFFSYIARWIKQYDLKLIPNDEDVVIQLTSTSVQATARTPKDQPKETIIRNIVHELEEKFTNLLIEDF